MTALPQTACARLRRALADGAWHTAAELQGVGGRRFPARLHEISRGEDGAPARAYEWREVDGRVEYRLTPAAAPAPSTTTARDADWTPSVTRARVVRCAACGHWRRESLHPHSPMWRERDGRSVLVDCVGREVRHG